MCSRKTSRSKHDFGLDGLLLHIQEHIPHPRVVAKETKFYGQRGGLVCEPDGIVYDGRELFLIEYKSCDWGQNRRRAERQLNVARDFIQDRIGLYVPIHRVYAHGNEVEFIDL